MHGAKGTVRNRIYQFWLIRIWREKQKKRKEKALLKRKKMEERRRKTIEEVIGTQDIRVFKLSTPPIALNKKTGVIVTLLPLGKKPDKVIEVIAEKKQVANDETLELQKKLADIDKKTTAIVAEATGVVEKEVTEPKKLEEKKKQLENDLRQIEVLQTEYQKITKKDTKILNIALIKDVKSKKTVMDNVSSLEKTELICKQELIRVEEALKKAMKTEVVQTEEKKQPQAMEIPKEIPKKEEVIQKETISVPTQTKEKNDIIKTGAVIATIAGGTLIAFPALLQRNLQTQNSKSSKTSNENSNYNSISNKKDVTKNNEANRKVKGSNSANTNHKSEKESLVKNQNNQSMEEKNSKLKLYRSKLEASKEAEILIKAELQRQKNYLRRINEKIEEVDVTKKVEYRFRGLHRLLSHVLTFTLGVFTIPFSKHRIFGTALGLALIGNSIRGMRNSLRLTEEHGVYIEWKDFSKVIYNEQLALKQLKTMSVDSLNQIKGLKEDVEREFYGKVSFQEYDEMRTKLEAMELKLIQKQKQIEEAEEQLKMIEEKNKVKVKRMEERGHH